MSSLIPAPLQTFHAPATRAGETCWRIERARRVSVLFDAERYFDAVRAALTNARQSILLLGWDFDPRTDLSPSGDPDRPTAEIGLLLRQVAAARPGLRIHVLIWDMVLPISILRLGYPHRSRFWFDGPIQFELDSVHPAGACHHQKLLVIDDQLAFCGGTDLAADRWDSVEHRDVEARRTLPSGRPHPPRHDLMMMVDGDVAHALGNLARARWLSATGMALEPPTRSVHDVWPTAVQPDGHDLDIAIARTMPARADAPLIDECRQLYVRSIESARRLIYLENQYIVAEEIERALAQRLAEPDGPEVVLICGSHSPSYFDRLTIDDAQHALLSSLRAADRFDRFRACSPVTAGGASIIVHSKAAIVDDTLLRIGSTNLNNRSLGFDTECDLAIDASVQRPAPPQRESSPQRDGASAARALIATLRDRMLGHHLGVSPEELGEAIQRHGGVIRAIESFAWTHRLRPVQAKPVRPEESPMRALIAEYHLGDPRGVDDVWRPWRRDVS